VGYGIIQLLSLYAALAIESPQVAVNQGFAYQNPDAAAKLHLTFHTEMSSTNYDRFSGFLIDQVAMETAPVRLRFRGFRRRNECTIIPLEVDLLGSMTYLSTARSFDLITHCHPVNLESNNTAVLVEFWQHRLAQLLLKQTLKVQLAEMTYTNGKDEASYEGLGILRESKRQMAARLGMKSILILPF
jgi:hypothetical protein